jgi:hypothetical protein
MANFRKFPEVRASMRAGEIEAAALADEMIAAAGRELARTHEAEAGPPAAISARILRDPARGQRGLSMPVFPEHILLGGLWLCAALAGLWQWLA